MIEQRHRTLDSLIKEFDEMLGKQDATTRTIPDDLTEFGFTCCEAEDWVKNEPDFTKRIVTPLSHG